MTRSVAVRWVLACLVALVLALPTTVGGAVGSEKGSTKSGGQATVHVKEYTKKDGTKVAAHERKKPESKTTAAETAAAKAPATTPGQTSVPRDANGKFQRSDAARHAFARQTGYPNGRPGYVIDHIVPLACGGADASSNMQWQTVAEAAAKDRVERKGCAGSPSHATIATSSVWVQSPPATSPPIDQSRADRCHALIASAYYQCMHTEDGWASPATSPPIGQSRADWCHALIGSEYLNACTQSKRHQSWTTQVARLRLDADQIEPGLAISVPITAQPIAVRILTARWFAVGP